MRRANRICAKEGGDEARKQNLCQGGRRWGAQTEFLIGRGVGLTLRLYIIYI